MAEEMRWINLGFVNVFLIKTDKGYILIDTGMAQQWSRLEKELHQAGCLPGNLKLVIITHGDADHTGNCAELRRKYGVKIAMHPADTAMVKTGIPVKRKARGILGKIFLRFSEREGGHFDCFEPDVLLKDGQALIDYGFPARVLHTPGHTPGSIAILTDDGQLFCGDTVASWTKPACTPFIENQEDLHASLATLKKTGARLVYPGHGKPFPFEAITSITC